nr:hypothetical protein [Hubei permutotetra-like virus 2]
MPNNKNMNKKGQKKPQKQKQKVKPQLQPNRSANRKPQAVNLLMGVPVTGREVITTLTAVANKTSVSYKNTFNISTASPLLKKYATIYESYKIKTVSYRFIPDESGLSSGNISIGIDYGKAPGDLTREQISRLNPHYSGPIRKITPWITIHPRFVSTDTVRYSGDDSLMSAPFTLALLATCESKSADRTLGCVEIQYTLEFQGILP